MAVEVILKFTDADARRIEAFLKTRYGRNGVRARVSLSRLCDTAVRHEVAAQANKEAREAESLFNANTADFRLRGEKK